MHQKVSVTNLKFLGAFYFITFIFERKRDLLLNLEVSVPDSEDGLYYPATIKDCEPPTTKEELPRYLVKYKYIKEGNTEWRSEDQIIWPELDQVIFSILKIVTHL